MICQAETESVISHLLNLKLEWRDELSDDERKTLNDIFVRTQNFDTDVDIATDGQRVTFSTLLLEGWAARYKTLRDGRRQITAFHVPGDFIDLHSFVLKRMDHGVVALTKCKVAMAPHEALRKTSETSPHLTRLLWLSTLIDAAIHREWITGMGQRSAHGRLGHLFCELYLRLSSVSLAGDHRFTFPITQEELGDALGFSTVHINRALRKLREMNLVKVSNQEVVIENWEGLVREAEFDPAYLHLEHEPR